jgi:hypothetical protein
MAPRPPIIDPTQPLPRLTLDEPWTVSTWRTRKAAKEPANSGPLPGRLTLDHDPLRDLRTSDVVIGTAHPFARGFIDEIDKKFRPVKHKDGMGCMDACYGVLTILYTEKVSKELRVEVFKRAKDRANAIAKAHPDRLKAEMAKAQAGKSMLTDEDAKQLVINQWISNNNTSDHLYRLMGERGMAEKVVNAPNAKAEEAIHGMTGDAPGLFFFGLAVKDNHTVTLAVERAADGSQRMYWLDQDKPGLSVEIKAGELGTKLQHAPGSTNSTNIYPFLPPTAGGA